jgi:heme-degrading monooxygenase HmoA
MFVLHIDLAVKEGSQSVLGETFIERFYPAVSAQGGFVAAQLLRSNDSDTSYRLCLNFDKQASQQTWVATDLHQEVWPLIADLCESFSVARYETV